MTADVTIVQDPMIANTLRVLPFLAGTLIIGMSLTVGVVYWRAWRATGRAGIVPYHVWLISLSYCLLVVASLLDMVERFGTPLTWRVPVWAVAYTTGLLAVWVILDYQRRRVHRGMAVKLRVEKIEAFDVEE